jgi:membrane protease YdiL (CAAX protease family)
MAMVLLLPALWGFLPLPRSTVPVLMLAWLSLWLCGRTWRELGLCKPHSWPAAVLGGLRAGGLIVWVARVVLPAVLQWAGMEYQPGGLYRLEANLPLFLLLLAGGWLLAALMEEMVFRGCLLNRLVDLLGPCKWGWGVSLRLSALAFSGTHGVYEP